MSIMSGIDQELADRIIVIEKQYGNPGPDFFKRVLTENKPANSFAAMRDFASLGLFVMANYPAIIGNLEDYRAESGGEVLS